MKAHRKARPSNCSHDCHNADFCIHQDEMRNTRKHDNDKVDMIKFPLELNAPVPNLPRWYRTKVGLQ
jgi:hypothetical protein